MKQITTIIAILLTTIIYGQPQDYEFNSTIVSCGFQEGSKKEIKATVYHFPNYLIEDCYYSTSSETMSILKRGHNEKRRTADNFTGFLYCDLANLKVSWQIKTYNSSFIQRDSMLFNTCKKGNRLYNTNSGEELYRIKSQIKYFNPEIGIAIGHGFGGTYGPSEIQGYDFNNGKLIWRKELASIFGWKDLIFINDTTVLLVSKGMSLINIKSGEGWTNINLLNNAKGDDYKKESSNVTMGMMTGSFSKSKKSLQAQKIKNTISIDSSSIYFINNNRINCISLDNGEMKWGSYHEDLKLDNAFLSSASESLYVYHKGYEFSNNKLYRNGNSYVASINKTTGEMFFFNKDTVSVLFDIQPSFNEFYSLNDNKVFRNSNQGVILDSISLNNEIGNVKGFTFGEEIYINSKGKYMNLSSFHGDKIVIFSPSGFVIILDNDLSLLHKYEKSDIFLKISESQEYTLLSHLEKSILITNNGTKIAELDINKNATIYKESIVDWEKKSIRVIDLDGITKNVP